MAKRRYEVEQAEAPTRPRTEDRDVKPPRRPPARRPQPPEDRDVKPPRRPPARRPQPPAKPLPKHEPPESGKAVEFHGKSKAPTVYVKDNVRWYQPNSAMYQMGFRNSDEYFQAHRHGKMPPNVAVQKEGGEWAHISQAEAKILASMRGDVLDRRLMELGILKHPAERAAVKVQAEVDPRKLKRLREPFMGEVPPQLPRPFQSMSREAQEFYERRLMTLPDGSVVSRSRAVELKQASPHLYEVLTEKGFDAYEREIMLQQYKEEKRAIALASYNLKDKRNAADIARFMRDNSDKAATDFLLKAGFTRASIEEAKKHNLENYATGAPTFVSRDTYTRKYFASRGWKYRVKTATSTDAELSRYHKRLTEASNAHKAEYYPTIKPEQFSRNYFKERGWEYDIKLGAATQPEIIEKNKRQREAMALYEAKYGLCPVVDAGVGKVADFVIPFYYVTKNWSELDTKHKLINLAIDVTFVAVVFGKPLSAGMRAISRQLFTDTGEAAMRQLTAAIRRGKAAEIRVAAYRVAQESVYGDRALMPVNRANIKRIQMRAQAIARNAEGVATSAKALTDEQIRTFMRASEQSAENALRYPWGGGKNWNQLVEEAIERRGAAQSLKKTAVMPVTRQEAKRYKYLNEQDLDRIASKVGAENRGAFMKEARKLNAERELNLKSLERSIEEKRVYQPSPEHSHTFWHETGRALKEKYPQLDPKIIDDLMAKVASQGGKLGSSMIYIQAKLYEAAMNAAVEKAIAHVKRMSVDRTLTQLNNENLLAALAASDPKRAAALYNAADEATRTKLQRALGTDLAAAFEEASLSKLRTAGRAETKAMLKQQLAAAVALARARETEVKTSTQTKVKTTTLTTVETAPVTAPAEATARQVAPARKPATKAPPPPEVVKPPPKPPKVPKVPPADAPPKKIPLRLRPRQSADDEEKRKFVDEREGFVARRRGALGGKSLWIINYYPYGEHDRLTLLGKAPEGAKLVTGLGSVAKSAVLLRGTPPSKPITDDTGAVDDVIHADGKKIIVTSVRDKENKPRQERRIRVKPSERELGGGVVQSGGRRHLKLS